MREIREAKNLADFSMVAKMFKGPRLKSQFVAAAKLRGLSNRLFHFTVSLHPPLYQSGGSHPDDDHSSGSGPEKENHDADCLSFGMTMTTIMTMISIFEKPLIPPPLLLYENR